MNALVSTMLNLPATTVGRVFFAALIACGLTSWTQAGDEAPVRLQGLTMGTTWSVQLAASNESPDGKKLRRDVQDLLDQLEQQLSTYREDSDVSRFNRSTTTNWFPVSPAVAQIVTKAQEVSRLSGGALDISSSPLIELWGFGKNRHARIPSETEIQRTRNRVGWQRIHARSEPPALRKKASDLTIDLSSIAKGFAVDVIAGWLNSTGQASHLVQIGGETRASGHKGNGQPWRVGIEQAIPTARSVGEIVELNRRSLATSGNQRNRHLIDGHAYGHILDPVTGHPVEGTLASVSVLADSCMEADAWATALFVLGEQRGLALAGELRLDCLFVPITGPPQTSLTNGAFQVLARGK